MLPIQSFTSLEAIRGRAKRLVTRPTRGWAQARILGCATWCQEQRGLCIISRQLQHVRAWPTALSDRLYEA